MNRSASTMSVGVVVALAALIMVYFKFRSAELDEPSAVERAVAALADGSDDDETERAHDYLLEMGEESVDRLLAALEDPETGRPEQVIRALARIDDARAVAPLRALLAAHPDARARLAAVQALAEFGDQEAIPALFERTAADPALQVRQAAVIALADLGEDSVMADLVAVLDETTVPELRQAAADTLEVVTDRDFGLDPEAAAAWLEQHGDRVPRTPVGGAGREAGAALSVDGAPGVLIDRSGVLLAVVLTTYRGQAMNILLECESGRIVIELVPRDGGLEALVSDAPRSGRPLARHAPLRVKVTGSEASLAFPRVGQLVAANLPASAQVVGLSEPAGE